MISGAAGVARRIAVVLFNLGGPDGPAAVRPFLENLFSDPAILSAPWLIRKPLAALIARARNKAAMANYALIGGGSPILPQTRAQALALEVALREAWPDRIVEVFIAMRYWRPMTQETARAVAAFAPDEVILAPLYPQYSTTTTASSLKAWREAYRGPGPTRAVCCWFENEGLIEAHADHIRQTWEAAGQPKVRLLFSAHGLPQKVVDGGDPYQWQIEATCSRVAAKLGPDWDWRLCYQSRVGPMKWLSPSTPQAITEAAADGLGILVTPIAFVSEHIETLVELDRDYGELAHRLNAAVYLRAPAPGTHPAFIAGLAGAVVRAFDRCVDAPDGGACPAGLSRCGRQV